MRTSQLPLEDQYWFSFIHIDDFRERSWTMYLRYCWMYMSLVGSSVLLAAEVFVGVCLVVLQDWAHTVLGAGLTSEENIRALYNNNGTTTNNSTNNSNLSPPSSLSPSSAANAIAQAVAWIILGSLVLSIGVSIWDWFQASAIQASDSIPEAYLHHGASQLWSARSYSHFCLLTKIDWGKSLRQRFVLMTYFALQAIPMVLMTLPRLAMYFCILASIAGAPGWCTGLFGQELPKFATEFSPSELGMLRAMLFIVIIATAVLLLELLRILVCLILWMVSFRDQEATQRTMYRDLHIRIETLLLSATWNSNTDKSAASPPSRQDSIRSKTSSAQPISWDNSRNPPPAPPPAAARRSPQQYQQPLPEQQSQPPPQHHYMPPTNPERVVVAPRTKSRGFLPFHGRKKSLAERTRTELQAPTQDLNDFRSVASEEYDMRSSVALRILDTASATSEYLLTEEMPTVILREPNGASSSEININRNNAGVGGNASSSRVNVATTTAPIVASKNNTKNININNNGAGSGGGSHSRPILGTSNTAATTGNNNHRYLKPPSPVVEETSSEYNLDLESQAQGDSGDERLKSAAAFMAQYMIPDHLMPLFSMNRASQSGMSTMNYPSPAMASSHLNLDMRSNIHPYTPPSQPERQMPLFNLASQRGIRRSIASTIAGTPSATKASVAAMAAAAVSSPTYSHLNSYYRPSNQDLTSSALTDMGSFIQAYAATEAMPTPVMSPRSPYSPALPLHTPVVAVEAGQPMLVSTALTSELVSLIQAYYSTSDRASPASTPPSSGGSVGRYNHHHHQFNNDNAQVTKPSGLSTSTTPASMNADATTSQFAAAAPAATVTAAAAAVSAAAGTGAGSSSLIPAARPTQKGAFYDDIGRSLQPLGQGQQQQQQQNATADLPPMPPRPHVRVSASSPSSPATGPVRKQPKEAGKKAMTSEVQVSQGGMTRAELLHQHHQQQIALKQKQKQQQQHLPQ
ncbi:hypothetical protein DFQ26_003061, partial [Actinomortierella ambigua]